MPDDTNIRPVEDTLGIIYEKTKSEIRNIFKVGRIFDLRGKIVHDGLTPSIHAQLQKYVEAIFVDIFFYLVGHPSEKRAEAVLSDNRFPLAVWQPGW